VHNQVAYKYERKFKKLYSLYKFKIKMSAQMDTLSDKENKQIVVYITKYTSSFFVSGRYEKKVYEFISKLPAKRRYWCVHDKLWVLPNEYLEDFARFLKANEIAFEVKNVERTSTISVFSDRLELVLNFYLDRINIVKAIPDIKYDDKKWMIPKSQLAYLKTILDENLIAYKELDYDTKIDNLVQIENDEPKSTRKILAKRKISFN